MDGVLEAARSLPAFRKAALIAFVFSSCLSSTFILPCTPKATRRNALSMT